MIFGRETRTSPLFRRPSMLKGESESCSAFVSIGPSGCVANERADDSASHGRTILQDHIGFVGVGHMGTAMATNLVAAGRQVTAYVRRVEQMKKLTALGIKSTTDITEV